MQVEDLRDTERLHLNMHSFLRPISYKKGTLELRCISETSIPYSFKLNDITTLL